MVMGKKQEKIKEKQLYPLAREFIDLDEDGSGKGLFYFHATGDYLKGILCGTQTRETVHYKIKTYLMKLWEGRQDGVNLLLAKEDQVVEFPANISIRRIIEDHELLGSLIRVVFTGRRGRIKLYDVFKDTGTFHKNEQKRIAKQRKKRSKKNEKVPAV